MHKAAARHVSKLEPWTVTGIIPLRQLGQGYLSCTPVQVHQLLTSTEDDGFDDVRLSKK